MAEAAANAAAPGQIGADGVQQMAADQVERLNQLENRLLGGLINVTVDSVRTATNHNPTTCHHAVD